ncbi:MAG: sialate O-acetylesterase [Prevotella sp.]|nr:sialate O-acetylesterase [Prevotella sp.]
MRKILSLLFVSLAILSAEAIELPEIIGDNMVVQQEKKARLWGWAAKGHYITATASWDNTPVTATVGKDGSWTLQIPTPKASYTQHTITLREYAKRPDKNQQPIEEKTLSSILVGEVWFCSGQSNMEMPLRGFWNCPVEGANETIARCGRYADAIRVATIEKRDAETPQKKVAGRWEKTTPKTAGRFSACGYYFAETVHEVLDVPVGIINCSWGGSCVEGWLPKDTLLTYPDGLTPIDDTDYHRKMVMFNGMLAPLAGYTIRGFLWNQGESNVGREIEYIDRFKTMTRLWRKMWDQPGDALPIYTVELPPYRYGDPDGDAAPKFRAAQHRIAHELENSGCVSTTDLFYTHEIDQIHGCKKREIGERLAYMALTRDYGCEGIGAEAPEYEYMEEADATQGDMEVIAGTAVEKNPNAKGKVLHLYFSNSTDGFDHMAGIEGFEARDEAGIWHKAIVWSSSAWQNVKRQGCFLSLACPEAKKITGVRYCYKNFAIGSLHNSRGLPVVPFEAIF